MEKKLLDYFGGDELASTVWEKKYKFEGEKTPEDSNKRYVKEISEKEMQRLTSLTDFLNKRKNLSKYGINRYDYLLNTETSKSHVFDYIKKFIGFDKIIPGGSMLASIGNHKLYSSLSNCFVLGRPYDSYMGISQKTEEMSEVMKRRGGCIEAHTKVIIRGENNKRIIKEIKDVKIGDYILSFNIETNKDEWREIKDHYKVNVPKDEQILYEYKNGTILKTSKYHPVLVIKNGKYDYASFEKRPENHPYYGTSPDWYNETGSINLPNKSPNKNYIQLEYDEKLSNIGWLLGAHMGDGTADITSVGRYRVRIKKSDYEPIQKYADIHNNLFGLNNSVVYKNDGLYHFCAMSNKNKKYFNEFLDNQINSKTYTGHIPSFIKNNNLYIPFIAGLIDTDGFVNEDGSMEITTCMKPMMEELSEILQLLNVRCSLYFKQGHIATNVNDKFILKIFCGQKIYKEISKYLCNPKRINNLKFDIDIYKSIGVNALTSELKLFDKLPSDKNSTKYHISKSNKLSFASSKLLLDYNLIDNDKFNEINSRTNFKAIYIDDDKQQEYYDITVEHNNNYYAGNFGFVVVHNCGLDLSSIRPFNAIVHNQASWSEGPILFANRYSNICLEVAMRARRGALMLSIHINHPDSIQFAEEKQDLTKLTGANTSIIFSDEFMQATEGKSKICGKYDFIQRFPVDVPLEKFKLDFNDLEYDTTYPCTYFDGKVNRTGYVRKINAKKAWNKITEYARNTAEPGIIFEDNWYQWGTDGVYEQYKPVTTNPCSEIPMQPYDSCRLLSTNLYSLVKNPFTKDAYFDFDEAYKIFYEQMTIGDIIVDLEEDYIKRIIEKIEYKDSDPRELKDRVISLWDKILKSGKEGRRVGAGFTALGDTLAALGLKYDYSDKTKNILNKIFETKMRAELDASIDMSILYGSFIGFDINKEYYISDDFHSIDSGKNEMFNRMLEIFPEQINRMCKYGRRNVSWSTAAPTGSLSILSQTTSGIEPLFSPFYMRRKKVIDEKTERIDYIDPADGQKFTMFPVFHPKFKWWIENIYKPGSDATKLNETEINEIFKNSPWFGSCANDINWKDRVYIQSLVQKYTTHAISSTINLPNDIKTDIVKNIYTESWKVGLKGNTIYRDGSRGGVLITSTNTDNKNPDSQDFDETRAPKRPIRLPAVYHTIRSKGKTYSVIIGFYQNKPYEVFIASDYDYLPQNLDDYNDCIKGEIVKEGKDWYNFESKTFILKEISDIENEEKMLSLMISMALRHRTPLKYVIKTIEKTKPFAGSFTHKLIKILSKYVPDGEESGTICPDCGTKLTFESGCCVCKNCGWSKC